MELVFTGVQLLSFGRTPKKNGIAVFAADFTKTLAGKLELEDIPENYTDGSPDVDLDATEFTIQSKDGDLAKWIFTVKCQSLRDVSIQRYEKEGKKGKGFRHRIFFKIRFADLTGCSLLEQYMVNQGENKGNLSVTCSKRPVQAEIQEAIDTTKQGELEGITS